MNKQTLAKTLNNTLKGDVIMKKAGEEILELLGGTGVDFFQQVFEENLEDRRILINDGIDSGVIEKIVMQIMKANKEDLGKPVEARKPIFLLINSLGGDVLNGLAVVDVITNSKTPVIGVAMAYAMSMSLVIFEACSERIALGKNTTLLMHDGNVNSSGSGKKVKDLMEYYETLDKSIKELIVSRTNLTPEEYDERYADETYLLAEKAKEWGFVDKIIGIDVDLDYILR